MDEQSNNDLAEIKALLQKSYERQRKIGQAIHGTGAIIALAVGLALHFTNVQPSDSIKPNIAAAWVLYLIALYKLARATAGPGDRWSV